MARRSTILLVALAAGVAPMVAPSNPASAAGELRIEVDGGGPLADLTHMVPGTISQSDFSVANDSAEDGVLRLRLTDIHEDDHGCVGPERAHGDVTCGDGRGELGRDLTVTVLPLAAEGTPAGPALLDGSILDLAQWTVVDPLLPAGTERSFRAFWKLPVGSPNDTQTDTIAFAAEFLLEPAVVEAPSGSPGDSGSQPEPDTAVLSARPAPTGSPDRTQVGAPASEILTIGELARTGFPMVPLTAAGGAVVLAGSVGRAVVRRRRRPVA